jgi:beta-carotene ketolase (CrtW type)
VNGAGRHAGLLLAAAIIGAWVCVLGFDLFRYVPRGAAALAAPALILLQCWLNVGLFIVAHDAMHASLAPGRPATNRAVGRLCLALYAGFSFDRMLPKHMAHHRHPGSSRDPDFHAAAPTRFLPWFWQFFATYFGWREITVIGACVATATVVLRAKLENVLLFWALPALLSAAQLFYFGTFLPHRHREDTFLDRHNARSNGYSWLVSLLTCFHFGYHHEHHSHPSTQWWQLPDLRKDRECTK